jgi:hypothetical protein
MRSFPVCFFFVTIFLFFFSRVSLLFPAHTC